MVESLRMEFRRSFMSSFFSSSIRIATGYSESVIAALPHPLARRRQPGEAGAVGESENTTRNYLPLSMPAVSNRSPAHPLYRVSV